MVYPLAFILVLGVLVFVHEFGHYAVAKLCGVRVEVFSLGFGKRLFGFKRGDTDYRISVLPIGGYVKMAGENPMEQRTGDPGEFMSHPRWQRFLIAIAGPAMNILLAFVVFAALFAGTHQYSAVVTHGIIGVITPGSPAEKAGFMPGDKIMQIDGIDKPTWEEIPVRVMLNTNQVVNVRIQRGGQVFDMKIKPEPTGEDKVGEAGWHPALLVTNVDSGKPAELAGIHPGDLLLAVNSTPIKEMKDLDTVLQQVKEQPVQLAVLRDGQQSTVTVKPEWFPKDKRYRLGVGSYATEELSLAQAVVKSYDECKKSSLAIFELVGRMVRHRGVSFKQISGPIGIGKIAGEALSLGIVPLLTIMAFVSINLAIFNLFPIPILDGGLMLMLLIESIMRRDIKQEVKERVYQVAFVFLVLFAAVVIYNDLTKTWPRHMI